jgi:hypothetical protein
MRTTGSIEDHCRFHNPVFSEALADPCGKLRHSTEYIPSNSSVTSQFYGAPEV